MVEYVVRPAQGRTFSSSRTVFLGDAGVDGHLRVDGLARYLQDVASDDWADSGINADDFWLARRTAWRLIRAGRWPRLNESVTLTTWCGGSGAAWAERRTDLEIEGQVMVEAASLWVPVGPEGRPRRVRPDFYEVYGAAAGGRKVSGRVTKIPVDPSASSQTWTIRRSDIDVVGHVNNAAVWSAVAEVAPAGVRAASVTHHASVELADPLLLRVSGDLFWMTVDDDVRVSGDFESD